MHFGPWRNIARAAIRHARPPLSGSTLSPNVPLSFDVPAIVRTLKDRGMAMGTPLPLNLLGRIRTVTDNLPLGEYGDFHDQPDVAKIVSAAEVLDVVRGYMGAEPELLECTLVIHHAEDETRPIHPQRRFHFDYAGWQSLNLFIYLTDVTEDSAHQVVLGTHRRRELRDVVRPWIPDAEIFARFEGDVHTITGPAGTMFFEDTEAFHRRLIMKSRRVMLNVLYASHRSWLSQGRLTRKYTDYLTQVEQHRRVSSGLGLEEATDA
jgi:hypothetical protein